MDTARAELQLHRVPDRRATPDRHAVLTCFARDLCCFLAAVCVFARARVCCALAFGGCGVTAALRCRWDALLTETDAANGDGDSQFEDADDTIGQP